jgi:hypothetical protein
MSNEISLNGFYCIISYWRRRADTYCAKFEFKMILRQDKLLVARIIFEDKLTKTSATKRYAFELANFDRKKANNKNN